MISLSGRLSGNAGVLSGGGSGHGMMLVEVGIKMFGHVGDCTGKTLIALNAG